MNTPENMQPHHINARKRKGQTLAEFALTLPILLILVFGVIEFGRIFQAWVTLQNSARTAARYATTGSYDRARYVIDESGLSDPTSIIPCVTTDERGTLTTFDPNGDGNLINVYDGGSESLFATWWDGQDCDPRITQHQDLRKDIVRILSITSEAHRGAAGLSVGQDPTAGISTEEGVRTFLYDVWNRPLPGGGNHWHRTGSDQRGWFDVMLCSSRPLLNEFSDTNFTFGNRFAQLLDRDDGGNEVPIEERAPVCLMNEVPPADSNSLTNPNIPWLDAGSAGDSVTIVVTFNHPLITPLGLAEYVQLQARRVAVNEAFRVADATRAIAPPGSIGGINRPPTAVAGNDREVLDTDEDGMVTFQLDGSASFDEPGGFIVSWTWYQIGATQTFVGTGPILPAVTLTGYGPYTFRLVVVDDDGAQDDDDIIITVVGPAPTNTYTPTNTFTPPPTEIQPFDCDLLQAGELTFFGNRVQIQFENLNFQSTTLTRARLNWRLVNEFPTMHVYAMSLDQQIHWAGQDYTPPTDTNADPSVPAGMFINSERTLPGESAMTWEAVFAGGPGTLSAYMTVYDFGGTLFTFLNPEGGSCEIQLNLPEPTPIPTINPDQPTPTASWTPDCASDQMRVRFVDFQSFGVVRLEVTNQRPIVGILSDFTINWIQRASGQLTLERVTVGGNGPADNITPTIRVWESGNASQDSTPPTRGRAEGTWLANYTFPPNSVTYLYMDFGGTTTTIQASFNVAPSDFNGTLFQIDCNNPGGNNGGPGGNNNGQIPLFEENTPVPTATRGPSNTPRPTFTPSRTFTPGPPTNTPRPQPTNTVGPSPTTRPTNTPPLPPTRTLQAGSGGEGG